MTLVQLSGRVLYLTEDPGLLRRQLEGENLPWSPALRLRDDISTDEITPAWACYHADERLGEFAYVGIACRDETPVEAGDVRRGGFAVSVSGRRRGKGSSREASPFAERAAGIRLVIAKSFERIYRENCQNLGILTSTDFSLLGPLARGEAIPLDHFAAGEGVVGSSIVMAGGLLPYSRERLAGRIRVPNPDPSLRSGRPPRSIRARSRPAGHAMTLAEKIIARHWVLDAGAVETGVESVSPGQEGFVRADLRFSHEYVTPMAARLWRELPGARIRDPGSVLVFRDHLTLLDLAMPEERKADGLLDLALDLKRRQEEFAREHGLRLYDELPRGPGGLPGAGAEAICHSKVLERYALPGQLIVGSDSHTPHSGAIGCVAFGIGTTALCAAWLTQDARLRVPESVLVRVRGRLPANVTAKDLMLHLLRQPFVREGRAIGTIVEYAGEAVEALSLDERATLTNMAAEIGAFTGIVRPDDPGEGADFRGHVGQRRPLVERQGLNRLSRVLDNGADGPTLPHKRLAQEVEHQILRGDVGGQPAPDSHEDRLGNAEPRVLREPRGAQRRGADAERDAADRSAVRCMTVAPHDELARQRVALEHLRMTDGLRAGPREPARTTRQLVVEPEPVFPRELFLATLQVQRQVEQPVGLSLLRHRQVEECQMVAEDEHRPRITDAGARQLAPQPCGHRRYVLMAEPKIGADEPLLAGRDRLDAGLHGARIQHPMPRDDFLGQRHGVPGRTRSRPN